MTPANLFCSMAILAIITGRYCFYSLAQNGFFARQGRHVALINVKVGTWELSPVPTFTFIGAKMWMSHSIELLYNQKSHDAPKKSRFADEIGKRFGEIEYRVGKVLRRWRGSGGNIRISHLMSFLFYVCKK